MDFCTGAGEGDTPTTQRRRPPSSREALAQGFSTRSKSIEALHVWRDTGLDQRVFASPKRSWSLWPHAPMRFRGRHRPRRAGRVSRALQRRSSNGTDPLLFLFKNVCGNVGALHAQHDCSKRASHGLQPTFAHLRDGRALFYHQRTEVSARTSSRSGARSAASVFGLWRERHGSRPGRREGHQDLAHGDNGPHIAAASLASAQGDACAPPKRCQCLRGPLPA